MSVKKRRNGKVSLCFNLDELEVIKLKMQGNAIVESFSDLPNSIIVGKKIPPALLKRINDYSLSNPLAVVEDIDSLYRDYVI